MKPHIYLFFILVVFGLSSCGNHKPGHKDDDRQTGPVDMPVPEVPVLDMPVPEVTRPEVTPPVVAVPELAVSSEQMQSKAPYAGAGIAAQNKGAAGMLEEARVLPAADAALNSAAVERAPAGQGYSHPSIHPPILPPIHPPIHPPEHLPYPQYEPNTENYLAFEENQVVVTREQAVSTFSIDVDTAAYSNVRRFIEQHGNLPPRHAVKLEEMINYFDYDYAGADTLQRPFRIHTEVAPAPWDTRKQLLQIGIKAYEPQQQRRPDANLVFLIDVSGSMRSPNKLPLLKNSLRMLVKKLGRNDRIALVSYAGNARVVLESTAADEQNKIIRAIDSLHAGGGTNGGAGIVLAYEQAAANYVEEGINRVLIASDGDLNVGVVDLDDLKHMIAEKRKSGIGLSSLGFGQGNYNYALMEQLADVGNGHAAYIDTLKEAHKVLVTELNSTLLTVANDVKIQVEFNPATVAEYRLLGYENRMLKREDFLNDKVDAGDIGAGHTVTALYELVPRGSDARRVQALRYAEAESSAEQGKSLTELAKVSVRYKSAHDTPSRQIDEIIFAADAKNDLSEASTEFRFAASVAGFGSLLKGGRYTGDWGYPELLSLAREARGNDAHGYRAEFLTLVELAQGLAAVPLARHEHQP